MDRYTKFILSVIAICLLAITIKLWEPAPAYSGFLDRGPTWGELVIANEKPADLQKLVNNIPLVRVFGTVNVR